VRIPLNQPTLHKETQTSRLQLAVLHNGQTVQLPRAKQYFDVCGVMLAVIAYWHRLSVLNRPLRVLNNLATLPC
jgi:hypothetical protein